MVDLGLWKRSRISLNTISLLHAEHDHYQTGFAACQFKGFGLAFGGLVQNVPVNFGFAMLVVADGVVYFANRFARYDRFDKPHQIKRAIDQDVKIGSGKGKQDAQAACIQQQRIGENTVAAVLQRYGNGRAAV